MNWKKIITLLIVLFILAIFFFELTYPIYSDKDYFIIKKGDNILKITSNLRAEGYIKSKISFIFSSFESNYLKNIKAGKYKIDYGLSNQEILRIVTSSQNESVDITIIPGKSIKEIANSLGSKGICNSESFKEYTLNEIDWRSQEKRFEFLKSIPIGGNLEGYLFPDTYTFDLDSSPEKVVQTFLENFEKKVMPFFLSISKEELHKKIIMASILEKEVKTIEDKRVVSGLLWKREANNFPLEVDSTLLYFLASNHPNTNDKSVESLYNTYKHGGLPKGPIANPGTESIKAAINPQESDYWFYLSRENGETIFSKSYGEHLINKAKFLDQ